MTASQQRVSTRSGLRRQTREGLIPERLAMVLSSLAPLFVLWAIRGIDLFPHLWVAVGAILAGVVAPTALLVYRCRTAKRENDQEALTVETAENQQGYVLTYLFAILLPFYRDTIDSYFEFAAMLTALSIIVFLFYHLNYHYINVLFTLRGYRVIAVHPDPDAVAGKYGRTTSFAVITRRHNLLPKDRIIAYRLSNTVYLEEDL